MAPLTKYDKERGATERLIASLSLPPAAFTDPHADGSPECGFDVIAQIDRLKVGVQVTVPGDRAEEAVRARAANVTNDGVYFMWAENNSEVVYQRFADAIADKKAKALRYDFTPYDETWLVMVAGSPETPGAVSTLLPVWFDTDELTAATAGALEGVKFDRVYLHSVLDVKQRVWVWTPHDRKWIQQL